MTPIDFPCGFRRPAELPLDWSPCKYVRTSHLGCWLLLISHSNRTFGSDFYEISTKANYNNMFLLCIWSKTNYYFVQHFACSFLAYSYHSVFFLLLSFIILYLSYCSPYLVSKCLALIVPDAWPYFRALRRLYSECLHHPHTELSMASECSCLPSWLWKPHPARISNWKYWHLDVCSWWMRCGCRIERSGR